MKKRMKTKVSRRLLSLTLSGAMVLSLLPVFAFAEERDGLCQHHPAHTPECGYVVAVEGQPCAHVCGDDCFTLTTACTHVHEAACYSDGVLPNQGEDKTADACAHVCTEESGCVTKTNTCVHTADDEACGYVEAVEGQPCGYVCTECTVEPDAPSEPRPEAACTLTDGCTLPDGHEGPCNAAPAHDCEGTLEPVEGDQGELLWACPVCGALLDAQGKELPAIRSISGTFNGSPADLDANGSLRINIANFPDGTFRAFVNRYDTDSDGSLSAEEVAAVTVMACEGLGIRSLKGIEYFTALTRLYCETNDLTTLDVSKNTSLTELDCPYNWLTSLDVSGSTALTELDCRENLLAELNVSKNTALTYLACGVNQLTKLDVSKNTALTYLACGANQLTKLDVSKNTALTGLYCGANQLTKLDVSKNTALTVLSCSENQLTKLDVSKNTALTELGCCENQLTELDVSSNTALTRLHCESNRLAALDLTGLSISDIDVSGQTPEAVLTPQNGKLTVDLAGLVGRENLSRVQNLTGGTMDSSGIVTIPVPDPPTGNIQISYQYDTRMQDPQLMPVTLTLMPRVPVIHDGTFNGSPAKLDKNGNLVINADNFPDAEFRAFVREYDTDLDGSLSAEEVGAVTYMNCNDKGIRSLKGIEYFTALTQLYCGHNYLTTLDVSKNTSLTQLDCCMNQLTTLDVSENTGLTTLACDSNQLTSLDLSGNTALKTIGIGNQKTTGKYIWRGSAYLLDLSGIVGPDKLSRVSVTPEGAYDSATGMVTLEAPVNGAATVKYMYNTGRGSMDVTITATPNPNYLDLTDNHDFDGQTQVLVDGVAYPIETEGGRYVMLPDTGDLLTIYTYKQGSVHEQYPTGMGVYGIDRTDEGAAAEKIDALDDLLQYAGCSIRVTGKRGIRMITALTKDNKDALTRGGLAGYTLAEYGTVVQWADTLGAQSLTLDTGKHNYAYKKGAANSVFATTDTLTQYTNVLVWDSLTNEQLGQDIVMRPYIILKDGSGNPVTLYGGTVSRSIGYIAYQNRAVFDPGTDAYQYVWEIIHAVYGDQYDSEYQG